MWWLYSFIVLISLFLFFLSYIIQHAMIFFFFFFNDPPPPEIYTLPLHAALPIYINLEQRVSGRMVLLDIPATGEENLIEQQSGNQMNDLEYRRKQLLKLQDAVIDLEDLSTGVSIADLTLTDFRIDLAQYLKAHPGVLERLPLGTCAVTTTTEAEITPGIIFCLRAEGDAAKR